MVWSATEATGRLFMSSTVNVIRAGAARSNPILVAARGCSGGSTGERDGAWTPASPVNTLIRKPLTGWSSESVTEILTENGPLDPPSDGRRSLFDLHPE